MVSMKDIAESCGVSVATVSKALNSQSDISDRTKELVRCKADELGYMVNAAARTLKTNRSMNIGVLFVDRGGRGLTHGFFAEVLDAFKVEAECSGYDITFINRLVHARTSSYLRHCLYRGFDGIALICVDFLDPQVQELIDSDLPVVTVDHIFPNRPAVISDNVGGSSELVRYAWEKGHRKIAFIHGEPTAVTKDRLEGFRKTCKELNIPIPKEYICPSHYCDAERTYTATKKLLSLPEPPTCILCPDDFSAIGAIRALREAKLRIPEDMSLMGYDGTVVSQVTTPRITTFRQDASQVGKMAARKLIDRIDDPDHAPAECVLVTGVLCPGESVADLR